ncbi:MAG TPA: ester cyclase [Archangium sp.]|uniref:ester cyclase n=1 Tax=Archangium sp. TaxID=1872627 RepID=UPI002E373CB9|nr:ester cyclase [Archangium sp.]HEX5748822.1 ester cyclase [Archangium sp.]
MRLPILLSLLAPALFACASPPAPLTEGAGNTLAPAELVRAHLRAAEQGDWVTAEAHLADDFEMQMKGMPFWVSIGRPNGLDMHKARKTAFPDFQFNEQVVREEGNAVTIAVYLTGTHTGPLDYPIDEVPKMGPTGRTIDLPAEYFTYYVEKDRIRRIFGEIPEGHGPPALKKQLGVED